MFIQYIKDNLAVIIISGISGAIGSHYLLRNKHFKKIFKLK